MRAVVKTKSGLPKSCEFLRQPLMRCLRNKARSASSVSLFLRERMRPITSDRLCFVKTSMIAAKILSRLALFHPVNVGSTVISGGLKKCSLSIEELGSQRGVSFKFLINISHVPD